MDGEIIEIIDENIEIKIGNMVDEEKKVKMVNLMMKEGGNKEIGINGMRIEVGIEIIEIESRREIEIRIIIRDRKKELLIGDEIVGGMKDSRIEENMRWFRIELIGKVDKKNEDRLKKMNGGKENERRIINGVENIDGEFEKLIVEELKRIGKMKKKGIGKDDKRF